MGWSYGPCRANCGGNNESITWRYMVAYTWKVISFHYPESLNRNEYHVVNTGYATTWRQAAVHWGESFKQWPIGRYYVYGYHFYWDWNYNREVYDAATDANDCKIYDGWWDKN
jgi:hypothetical protein